jgi:hypothetical protein
VVGTDAQCTRRRGRRAAWNPSISPVRGARAACPPRTQFVAAPRPHVARRWPARPRAATVRPSRSTQPCRLGDVDRKDRTMLKIRHTLAAALAAAFAIAAVPAQAKGCLKGAVVGGVAGHVAGHHAVAGAVVGCAVGHHVAAKREREQREAARAAAANPPPAVSAPRQ